MSFLEILGDLAGTEGMGAGSSGQMGNIVRQGLSEGLSANAMLRGLKDNNIGIRRGNFLGLVSDIRASIASGRSAEGVDPFQLINRQSVGTSTASRVGVYRSNVTMRFRGPAVGGERMIESTTFTVTHESILRPIDVINAAREIWSTHSDLYDSQLLDSEYSGTVMNPGL